MGDRQLATYHAIGTTGNALEGILANALPSTPEFADTEIKLVQASEFKNGSPLKKTQGLSIYLYRIAPNGSVRNFPPRIGPDGQRYRPSLPLDLHFMITPWGPNPTQQHWLIGWAMRILENVSILPAGLLNQYAHGSEPDPFNPTETVELICESLSVQDLVNVGEVFKAQGQPPALSVSYIARVLMLESTVKLPTPEAITIRGFEFEKHTP